MCIRDRRWLGGGGVRVRSALAALKGNHERRVQKRFTYHGLSTHEECMQMNPTAGPKRKYNSPSHPGMLPFEVIEIAAAAVSCAAPGGLSLGSGGWTSSCATHARLVEVQDSESPPAGVDRTKCDEFASKGTTPGRGQSFPEGVEMSTFCSSSSFENSPWSFGWWPN